MNILDFINFIIDLVNEDSIFLETNNDSKYYFMNGGCYELYKIVKHYFPSVECMIEKSSNHCAILYKNKIYDATGIRNDIDNFKVANNYDIKYMNNFFGLDIKDLQSSKIISDIDDCNIKQLIKNN